MAANQTGDTRNGTFKSGGGFSNYIGRPSFQDAVVQSYIDGYAGNLSATAFNRSGRAYPDVSANGYVSSVSLHLARLIPAPEQT